MKLETKIMLAATGAVALATALGIGIVYHLSCQNRIAELRGKMSSIIAQSEQVAANMDDMHRSHVFDTAGLQAAAKGQAQGRPLREIYASTDLYKTIPIVAAWRSVESAAQKEGFQFFTPSHPELTARNVKNANGAEFAAAFEAFKKGAPEFFLQDRSRDELILARPVRLQSSCLTCHGDPAKSLTGDGKDLLGFPMENLKLDQLKGAFVLKAGIGHDPVVMATMRAMACGGGLVLLLVLAGFYWFNRRVIVGPLAATIQQIEEASNRTAAAAAQISSASQSLAEGAGEQAAALEQTSASLEEMSGMTKRNAESADKANDLARQTCAAGDNGAEDMQAMNAAMEAIRTSSNDIGKIIKTIDEIAFQTNILALNAAVEAARAGEAGLGFAVVADEVRNLAQRCAQSAKETGAKIESAIGNASQGVAISAKVTLGLQEIVAKVRRVDELAAEVAVASKEQSLGISQVNVAVSEMDRVTQANAACAEESASAAGELNSQAEALREAVGELLQLVNGTRQGRKTPAHSVARKAPSQNLVKARASGPRLLAQSARPATAAFLPTSATPPAPKGVILWEEARMATGFAKVDAEHQELIGMINRLHQACLDGAAKDELGRLMNFLGTYVQTHFSHEEELMEEHRCPTKEANKKAHRQFLKEFEKLAAEFQAKGESTAIVLSLKGLVAGWLTNHICEIDTKLRSCACPTSGTSRAKSRS